jgi:DNA-binding NtrC family response regulator
MELIEMDKRQAPAKAGTTSVLIVDADPQVARVMLQILARRGILAHIVDRGEADLAMVSLSVVCERGGHPGRIVDPPMIHQLRTNQPELPVIVTAGMDDLGTCLSGQAHPDNLAEALIRLTAQIVHEVTEAGANGFLLKPLDCNQVGQILDRYLPARRIRHLASAEEASHSLYQIVGKSASMVQVMGLAHRVAPTSAPVLISGESGTGKELLSYLIHHKSRRALGPYIRVNCAALSESLLESELFGHEKGAFTGAIAQHKGRFERAHDGTLLLDEITETPPSFQAKLLRILEHQEFERVGGHEAVKVNVRLLSTTNKDLLEEVRHGRFRQDLYYRLSAMRLVIPPLRDRLEDLPELVWYFVNQYARESQRAITALDPMMMEIFSRYDWPGNVRQLRNVVRTCLILGTGVVLRLADVSWLMDGARPCSQGHSEGDRAPQDLCTGVQDLISSGSVDGPCGLGGLPLEVIERLAILETLEKTSGNRKKAAEVLGISDRTLRERIRRYKQQPALQPV